ncbi:mannosyltransferase [Aurantimonas sp. Leaf443]|nr:mannosyltransferase [Aurantimonas sp. Leaf443]
MRVLLTTYHQAFLSHGGGETELRQLADFINDLGVRADLYGPGSRKLSFYDGVIHFSAHGGGEALLRDVKAHGTPIVLIPNFNFFEPNHSARDVVQTHLDLADLVILRTQIERTLCLEHFRLAPERAVVVSASISDAFAKPVEDDLFKSAYALDRFVLSVGQIEEGKEQLRVIEALRGYELPLVFIGGHRDKAYYDRCRAAADASVRFVPYVQPSSPILRSAFQSCSAYIELGIDYPGFSALEAGLSGRPLVLRDHPWSRELLGDAPNYVDRPDPAAIVEAVDAAVAGRGEGALVDAIRARHVQPGPTEQLLTMMMDLTQKPR